MSEPLLPLPTVPPDLWIFFLLDFDELFTYEGCWSVSWDAWGNFLQLAVYLLNFSLIAFGFFKCLFLRETDRETELKQGRGRETERETQNPKQSLGSELSAQSPMRGSNSDWEIMT